MKIVLGLLSILCSATAFNGSKMLRNTWSGDNACNWLMYNGDPQDNIVDSYSFDSGSFVFSQKDFIYKPLELIDSNGDSTIWNEYRGDGVKVAVIGKSGSTPLPNAKISSRSYDYNSVDNVVTSVSEETATVIALIGGEGRIAGVAPNSEIYVYCVDDYDSANKLYGTSEIHVRSISDSVVSNCIDAINKARYEGCEIIEFADYSCINTGAAAKVLSFITGLTGNSTDVYIDNTGSSQGYGSEQLHNAISAAAGDGISIIAPIGEISTNSIDEYNSYPGMFNEVISVGSHYYDPSYRGDAVFANNRHRTNVRAPGYVISANDSNASVSPLYGTVYSSAMVAGIAALFYCQNRYERNGVSTWNAIQGVIASLNESQQALSTSFMEAKAWVAPTMNTTVSVYDSRDNHKLSYKEDIRLESNNTYDFRVELNEDITQKRCYWSSVDESVAIVDNFGRIKPLKAGYTEITVECVDRVNYDGSNFMWKYTRFGLLVDDYIKVESITCSKDRLVTSVSANNVSVQFQFYPTNATRKEVDLAYNSSSLRVNSVSGSHYKIGGKQAGVHPILYKSKDNFDGYGSQGISVYVVDASTEVVELSEKNISIDVNETHTLSWNLSPSYYQTVSFTSSNDAIASVDEEGKITGINPGTATITITTQFGNSDTCEVLVRGTPASQIILDQDALNLDINETSQLTWHILPAEADEESIYFSVDQLGIVSVSNEGLVTAIQPGTVIITIHTSNDLTDTCTVVVSNSHDSSNPEQDDSGDITSEDTNSTTDGSGTSTNETGTGSGNESTVSQDDSKGEIKKEDVTVGIIAASAAVVIVGGAFAIGVTTFIKKKKKAKLESSKEDSNDESK